MQHLFRGALYCKQKCKKRAVPLKTFLNYDRKKF